MDAADKFGAIVMVDDAHGEGVLGRGGRGIVDHFELHGRVDIEVGTLSKAFGVVGGYVAGSAALIEYLRQRARPFLFSSATTAADVSACIAAVRILATDDSAVKKLWENTQYFQERVRALGYDTGRTKTPITPIIVGDAQKAKTLSAKLFEEDVFAQAIAYPTVPQGKARIRCMVSASHSKGDLDFAADKLNKVGKELGII